MSQRYDLVLLAGGAATRLGGVDKVALALDGTSSLERLLLACTDANRVIAVGPARYTSLPVTWVVEDPPLSGPLAAVSAAVPFTSAPVVLVAAGDMPFVGEAKEQLLGALAGDDGPEAAALCDGDAVRQPLAAAYARGALVRRLAELGDVAHRPARLLLEGLRVKDVPGAQAAADVDTWDDVYRIEEEMRRAR